MREIVTKLTENRQIQLAKEILESNGYKVSKVGLSEGLFDNKAKKTNSYDEEIKKVFGDPTMRVIQDTVNSVETLLNDCTDSDKDPKEILRQFESFLKSTSNDLKSNPERIVSTLLNIGRKYAMDSVAMDDLTELQSNIRTLKRTPKIGDAAVKYLISSIGEKLVNSLTKAIDYIKKNS